MIHTASVRILALVGIGSICCVMATGCMPSGDGPLSDAAVGGQYITWIERIVDDSHAGRFVGADGFAMADLDGDGLEDIASVHEDTSCVRLHFAFPSAGAFESVTLACGPDYTSQVEDVALGDLDGDGTTDAVTANEAGYLAVFGNPGEDCRQGPAWRRSRITASEGTGSWIRVDLADVDGDGRLDVLGANKGGTDFCWFRSQADPFDGERWERFVIGTTTGEPINVRAHDVDGDGDPDVLAGSRKDETWVSWFENPRDASSPNGPMVNWTRHPVTHISDGFNIVLADLSGDGRQDVCLALAGGRVGWAEGPPPAEIHRAEGWDVHAIGCIAPDAPTGLGVADINGDGRVDVIVGGYSDGPREFDGPCVNIAADALGRLAWFEQGSDPRAVWVRHDLSRRIRGMFDHFEARDLNGDGRVDWLYTRGNSGTLDGVFWLEQRRSADPASALVRARLFDSAEVSIPHCEVER